MVSKEMMLGNGYAHLGPIAPTGRLDRVQTMLPRKGKPAVLSFSDEGALLGVHLQEGGCTDTLLLYWS